MCRFRESLRNRKITINIDSIKFIKVIIINFRYWDTLVINWKFEKFLMLNIRNQIEIQEKSIKIIGRY